MDAAAVKSAVAPRRRDHGQARHQHRALRPHPAHRRPAGRAGAGAARDRGGGSGRPAQARRFLLDPAFGVREPPRPARDLRPGVPCLLAQSAAAGKDDGDAAAGRRRQPATKEQANQPSRLQEELKQAAGEAPRKRGRQNTRSRGRGDLHGLGRGRPAASQTTSRCRRPRSTRRCARISRCACRCRSGARAAISRRTRTRRQCDFRASLRRRSGPDGLTDLRAERAVPEAAASRHPVRHLRVDGPLHAHVPAFHARDHQRSRPRPLLHLRHAAQQRQPGRCASRDVGEIALAQERPAGRELVRRLFAASSQTLSFNNKWSHRVLRGGRRTWCC